MGHVKVVKSSPYFSRFQTKVRAAATSKIRASPSRKERAPQVSKSAGGGHQSSLIALASSGGGVYKSCTRCSVGVRGAAVLILCGMRSTSGGRAARRITVHAFG